MRKSVIPLLTICMGFLLIFTEVREQKEKESFQIENMEFVQASFKERTAKNNVMKENLPKRVSGFEHLKGAIVESEQADEISQIDSSFIDETLPDETGTDTEADAIGSDSSQVKSPDAGKTDSGELQVGFVVNTNGMLEHFYDGAESVQDGYLELPTGLFRGITADAFTSYSGRIHEIYIPDDVTDIQFRAFAGLGNLEWLEVSPTNMGVASVEGVIFNKSVTELITFPSARTGIYGVPKSVTYIGDGAFYNTQLSRIELLDMSYITIDANAFGPNQGTGVVLCVPAEFETDYRIALAGTLVQIEGVSR